MDEDTPRRPSSKGKQETRGYCPHIIVKFYDKFEDIPYEDGAEKYLEKLKIGPWERLAKEFPGLTIRRLYTVLKPEQIRSLVEKKDKSDQTNMLTYFLVDCPKGVAPEVLVKKFKEWPSVQTAYHYSPGSDPVVNPSDDPRFGDQKYLDPAPVGIDAKFAWRSGLIGSDGAGISVIDLEKGWTLNHQDLSAHGVTTPLHGTIRKGSRHHGTKVLGVICAVDNAHGCIGIAPHVDSVNVVSYHGSTRSDAILKAIDNLQRGDILLLEAQVRIKIGNTTWRGMPIEVNKDEFDMISLATSKENGIVVIEAAGNGKNDLDMFFNNEGDQILNRGSASFRDSGAIMVGAGKSSEPHGRGGWSRGWSSFGSRLDCYAWGENVDTTSSNNAGSTVKYTKNFGGTSSASAIVTGAALIVQGVAKEKLGRPFTPQQIRTLLSDVANGTESNDPDVDRIGVMPDLRKIFGSLKF